MATLLERLAETRDQRAGAERDFAQAILDAKPFHSWAELAAVAGLSPSGVRYVVGQDGHKKGETTP